MSRIILHTKASGGSPAGLSFYNKWAECPKRANLDAQAKACGEKTSSDTDATSVGSILHHYLEYYYSGSIGHEDVVIEYADASGFTDVEIANQEAQRLFVAYRQKFPREEAGFVLGVEKELPDPKSEFIEQCQQAVKDLLGVEFTCRLDLITDIDETTAAQMQLTRGIDIEPGVWLWDHKSADAERGNASTLWEADHQMTGIYYLWNLLMPPTCRAKGVLVNTIYKTKVPKFRTYVVRPTGVQLDALRNYLKGIQAIKEHPVLNNWANANKQCFFPKTCHWYMVGKCFRQ